MEYTTRTYPEFSACGLNCGLCPRYHTNGTSQCPGCSGIGFSENHPSCGVLSCSQKRKIEYCYLCDEYPCKKYDGADLSDSFITHKNQLRDIEKAKEIGIVAYKGELNNKIEILKHLLQFYDDGRRKSFFCVAMNLLDIEDINLVVRQLSVEAQPDIPVKNKSETAVRLFQEMAATKNILLQLRKK